MEYTVAANNKLNIEDQFILRLPPSVAKKVRKMVRVSEENDTDFPVDMDITFGLNRAFSLQLIRRARSH